MLKSAYQKTKKFVKSHPDEIFYAITVTVVSAASIGTLVWATKEYSSELAAYEASKAQLNEFTMKSNAEGKAVFVLDDGSYIAVRPQDIS